MFFIGQQTVYKGIIKTINAIVDNDEEAYFNNLHIWKTKITEKGALDAYINTVDGGLRGYPPLSR